MVTPVLSDSDYMDRALFLAERGRGRTSPNPMVGAVVVSSDGVVVGQGYHQRAGEAHAEVHALDMAGRHARGGTLYSTLEPCSHEGRTGPCVVRIVEAGITRVVGAVVDPNPRVSGRGFAFLQAHGLRVDVGPGKDAAVRLNQPFFTLMRERRPLVILKAAISQDGFIAETPGRPTRLTSAAADRHAHRLRAEIDAIAVGVGTVLADDPQLTSRGAFRERPLVRVVFDRDLRTPPDGRLLSNRDGGPVVILTTAACCERARARRGALESSGADVLIAPDGTMRSALECLGRRGISSLLLEGGAKLHRSAWEENVVDLVRLYVTPHVLGGEGVRFLEGCHFATTALIDRRVVPLGPDVLIEGYVHGPH
jgi:diaminohydroxyphosphoribosylaminopyrimidine deaminase/5-amino-6-(5-phosphoribosylamino)uracil reductase